MPTSFELPPAALSVHGNAADVRLSPSSAASNSRVGSSTSSSSSYHPASPKLPATASETVKIRRRTSLTQNTAKNAFALPPPPTRSRKIIQMEPRGRSEHTELLQDEEKTAPGKIAPSPKKKQPSTNSVASRKIARKTAHSLIERRRRSKMNEEFGVLKDMVPACTGEMHKLAILQVRCAYSYLLKADCRRPPSTMCGTWKTVLRG